MFTTHPCNQLPLPVAESLCSLSVSVRGAKGCTGSHGAGPRDMWERGAAPGPGLSDPSLRGELGRQGSIPSPPLLPLPRLFLSSFQKRAWMLTCYNVGQSTKTAKKKKKVKKRRRRMGGGGGPCGYSETTGINRAEKNSGKKSAQLRVKGFCCWL